MTPVAPIVAPTATANGAADSAATANAVRPSPTTLHGRGATEVLAGQALAVAATEGRRLEALAVLFEALRVLAVAASGVALAGVDLGHECRAVAFFCGLNRVIAYGLVIASVIAVAAIAAHAVAQVCEALAVQLEAFTLAAIAAAQLVTRRRQVRAGGVSWIVGGVFWASSPRDDASIIRRLTLHGSSLPSRPATATAATTAAATTTSLRSVSLECRSGATQALSVGLGQGRGLYPRLRRSVARSPALPRTSAMGLWR